MSKTLIKQARKLLQAAKLKSNEFCKFLKKITVNTVRALSEIALNVAEGVLKSKHKKHKLIKLLADKKQKLLKKQKALKAKTAVQVIKAIIVAAVPVLKFLIIEHG